MSVKKLLKLRVLHWGTQRIGYDCMSLKVLQMGNLSLPSQSSTKEEHNSSQRLKSDLKWLWLSLFPRAQKKSFRWKACSLLLSPIFSLGLSYMHKKHKVFMTPCSRGHIQTFIHYSLIPNTSYHLSSSCAFMWLRWLNKNAVRGADPDLWPVWNVHTNVKPITSFLLRVTTWLNSSSCWQVAHWSHQQRREDRKA